MDVNQIERINTLTAYFGVEVEASFGETAGLDHVLKRQSHSELFLYEAHRLFKLQFGHAKFNDIDPEAYLRFVIGRIADHPVNRLDGLLLIRSAR